MNRSTAALGALALSLLTCAVTSSPTLASGPTALLLPGEAFPVKVTGSSKTAHTEIETAAGKISGEGYEGAGELTTGTTGSFSITLFKIKRGEANCSSEGDEPGVVLFGTSEAEAVYISLSPLEVGLLVHVKTVKLMCGIESFSKMGTVLSTLSPINSETTSFTGGMECSATVGLPVHTKYWNSSGVEGTALLLANIGTGFKKACITASAEATSNKMLEIMG